MQAQYRVRMPWRAVVQCQSQCLALMLHRTAVLRRTPVLRREAVMLFRTRVLHQGVVLGRAATVSQRLYS